MVNEPSINIINLGHILVGREGGGGGGNCRLS